MWKSADIKIAMMRDRDRQPKNRPFLWRPVKAFSIPNTHDELDHGRPLLILNGEDPKDSVVIKIYRGELVLQMQDKSEIVISPPAAHEQEPA